MPTQQEKLLAALGHLSYLAGLPIVAPLLLYLWQRDVSQFVAEQAKQAILIHLAMTIMVTLAVGATFATFGLGGLFTIPMAVGFGLVAFVLTVYAVIQVANGRHYRYPLIGGLLDGV